MSYFARISALGVVPVMPPGGSVANWIQALEVAHAIPGHGPIQTASALADLRRWFLSLRTQVGEAQALGWDRETTITHVAQQLREYTLALLFLFRHALICKRCRS